MEGYSVVNEVLGDGAGQGLGHFPGFGDLCCLTDDPGDLRSAQWLVIDCFLEQVRPVVLAALDQGFDGLGDDLAIDLMLGHRREHQLLGALARLASGGAGPWQGRGAPPARDSV